MPQVYSAAAMKLPPPVYLPIEAPASYADNLPAAKPIDDILPTSTVRSEYRNSGRWLTQPPPAKTQPSAP